MDFRQKIQKKETVRSTSLLDRGFGLRGYRYLPTEYINGTYLLHRGNQTRSNSMLSMQMPSSGSLRDRGTEISRSCRKPRRLKRAKNESRQDTPVLPSSPEPPQKMDRSTWDSAAKWNTPSKRSLRTNYPVVFSGISPRINP